MKDCNVLFLCMAYSNAWNPANVILLSSLFNTIRVLFTRSISAMGIASLSPSLYPFTFNSNRVSFLCILCKNGTITLDGPVEENKDNLSKEISRNLMLGTGVGFI